LLQLVLDSRKRFCRCSTEPRVVCDVQLFNFDARGEFLQTRFKPRAFFFKLHFFGGKFFEADVLPCFCKSSAVISLRMRVKSCAAENAADCAARKDSCARFKSFST
jgi:hypothetical protein